MGKINRTEECIRIIKRLKKHGFKVTECKRQSGYSQIVSVGASYMPTVEENLKQHLNSIRLDRSASLVDITKQLIEAEEHLEQLLSIGECKEETKEVFEFINKTEK
jgi:ACT domain-containing protein